MNSRLELILLLKSSLGMTIDLFDSNSGTSQVSFHFSTTNISYVQQNLSYISDRAVNGFVTWVWVPTCIRLPLLTELFLLS